MMAAAGPTILNKSCGDPLRANRFEGAAVLVP